MLFFFEHVITRCSCSFKSAHRFWDVHSHHCLFTASCAHRPEAGPARPRILRLQWRYNSLLTIAHMPLIPQSSRHYHSQACSSLTFVPAAPQPCPGFAVPCPISYIPTATTSYSAQCSSSRHGCCCCWLEGAVVNFSKALKPIHTLLPLQSSLSPQ